MWSVKQVSESNPAFVSATLELLQATSRSLILTTGLIYGVWHVVATLTWPGVFIRNIWLISPLVLLTCGLAWWLLPKHLLLAQGVWQGGLAVSITFAFYLYQQPEVVFLYTLLPLMAVVTVGRRGGLLTQVGFILLLWGSQQSRLFPPLPAGYALVIVLGGVFTGLLGWAVSKTLLTVAHWSLFSFDQAQKSLAEANQHRAEMTRVLKNLDQTYHQLERANYTLVLAWTKAEEAQAARDRFALAVSHELRTPLNFILGFSEMMVNSPEMYADPKDWPPGLYEDVEEIYRSSTHLQGLVNDILDLGQIDARQMTLFKETVDLPHLVQEVEKMVRPVFERQGLSLQTEIPPELPPVFVDSTRIRQVLLNLINNSLRFTERGGVTVRLMQEAHHILVEVEDTGLGIATDDIPKLFEAFRQVGEVNWRRGEGSGLGIPISRRFVELHGGTMGVESTLGEGTCFHFTLPFTNATPDLHLTPTEVLTASDYWQTLKSKAEADQTILVVARDGRWEEKLKPLIQPYRLILSDTPADIPLKIQQFLPLALIVDDAWLKTEDLQPHLANIPYHLPVISFTLPAEQVENTPPSPESQRPPHTLHLSMGRALTHHEFKSILQTIIQTIGS